MSLILWRVKSHLLMMHRVHSPPTPKQHPHSLDPSSAMQSNFRAPGGGSPHMELPPRAAALDSPRLRGLRKEIWIVHSFKGS